MKYPEVKITKYKHKGKWKIRITGITSGFETYLNDFDEASIVFTFDASRFEPIIRVGK